MHKNIKTVKFGGSSLASAEQFKKVTEIIKADSDRRYVVASAPGKRNSDDFKITDKLYECYELASKGENIDRIFAQLEERYRAIVSGLGVNFALDGYGDCSVVAISTKGHMGDPAENLRLRANIKPW